METTFYLITALLTIINAVLAYVLYSKITEFDEIFSGIYMNREQIGAIDDRLSSIEDEMEDFSEWDVLAGDGLEDEDEEDEEEALAEYINDIANDIEDNIVDFNERLTAMELSLNNHVTAVNEMMTFIDRMVGRLDQIEQHLRDQQPGL
jgi:DNA repair ATPase RecN